ncbi:sensor histidine kinase [Streptomyces sp. NPDC014734]|uniref:sensor histidine kinase n=1 Tax=Streptomyces sp. NPDC014734 TaxID=3364886 RepID=UPI0036FFA0F9
MDALLWAALMAAGVLGYRQHPQSFVTGLLLPAAVLAVAVPGSRRRPGTAVFLANGLCALGLTSPGSPANAYLLAPAVLSFLLGAGPRGRTADGGSTARPGTTVPRALWLFTGCVVVDLGICAAQRADAVYWFYTAGLIPPALVLPWLAGRYRQARKALVDGGWQHALGLEQRQQQAVERARLRERTRIAADMHDSLGHELSLIALRAGALELSPGLTARDRDDVAALRAMVSDAVDHLRDTIGVLREDAGSGRAGTGPSDADPLAERVGAAASPESVEQLVDRARASGADVTLHRTGGTSGMPPLADRALYRIVQESLTNALKHAPGSSVAVRISRDDGGTEVRVSDSRRAVRAPRPVRSAAPGRHGLAGMRERVLLLGGTLRAAPTADGFEVAAVLPDRPRAGPPESSPGAPDDPDRRSVPRLASAARRRAGLRLLLASGAPVGIGLVALVSALLLGHRLSTCVLRPADYAALRVGDTQRAHAAVLPERSFRYPTDRMRALPSPTGSRCAFYRSNVNVLEQVDVYRLCWSDARLVSKDVLPGRPSDG